LSSGRARLGERGLGGRHGVGQRVLRAVDRDQEIVRAGLDAVDREPGFAHEREIGLARHHGRGAPNAVQRPERRRKLHQRDRIAVQVAEQLVGGGHAAGLAP
jgi:hypothetical protein